MAAQLETSREQRVARAREALQRARSLRATRRAIGVDGICQHVAGVDSNWLENWSEEDVELDEQDWNYLYSDMSSQLEVATVLLVVAEFLNRSQNRAEGAVNGTNIIFHPVSAP